MRRCALFGAPETTRTPSAMARQFAYHMAGLTKAYPNGNKVL